MAIPEADQPRKGALPQVAGGNRPLPAGSSASMQGNRPYVPGGSNRPILLKPRSASDLPDTDENDLEEEEDADLKDVLRNAPAWLVSTVFHMLVLIVLGLLAISARTRPPDLHVEVSYSDPGEQLEDPSVLESTATEIETLPEQLITPLDLTPVDDPLAAPPELAELDLPLRPTAPSVPNRIEGAPIGLALKGREAGTRRALLQKYGGTEATEGAVEAGLKWLVRQQRSDGTWSLKGPYADGSRTENVAAATAMALLAFQGHGDTHRQGEHAKVVARGWNALLKLQGRDGLFTSGASESTHLLYTHAQCTIALCELYGMTQDSSFRSPADRAIAYAIAAQDKQDGGWRYQPGIASDTSVTGWFVMALQSARMARMQVPKEVLDRVSGYLDLAQIDGGRRYGYWRNTQPTHAVSAEGLLCRQYLGWPQNDPRLVEGLTELLQKAPIAYDGGINHDVYYWYYMTQAAHHMEGDIWNGWNKVMREIVPQAQIKEGAEAGSWDPQGDKWAGSSGRLYMTCLSIYMLEVYYRHLPIYSGYRFVAGVGQTMDPDARPSPSKQAAPPAAETPPPDSAPSDSDETGKSKGT